jgi:hypothetical protein
LLIVVSLAAHNLFAQKGYRQSHLKAGNFLVQNRKVHFDKTYPQTISMVFLEQKLKSLNDPTSGMQIKSQKESEMKGVMIRYQLDWTTAGFRNWRIARNLKYPVNANFEVVREHNYYRVRITDIWFTNLSKPGSQQHLTLEDMVLKKNNLGFRKNKRAMRALYTLDLNLEDMFSSNPPVW